MSADDLVAEVERLTIILATSDSQKMNLEILSILGIDIACGFNLYESSLHRKLTSGGAEIEWTVREVICRYRMPDEHKSYCSAEIINNSQLDYFSIASNGSSRIPRVITGKYAATFYDKHHVSYVIESAQDAKAWLLRWHSRALIADDNLAELIRLYH